MEMSISDNILQKYDSRSEIGGLQDAMMCGLDTVTQTKRQQQAELRMLGFIFGMIRMALIRNGLNSLLLLHVSRIEKRSFKRHFPIGCFDYLLWQWKGSLDWVKSS